MTFPRIKPANWAVNETLTSAQANALDVDHSLAMDQATMTQQVSVLSAQNWNKGGANTNNIKRGAWSTKDQAWFAVGDGGNDFGEVSYDYGKTWTNLALGLTLVYTDAAVSPTGTVCIMTSARNIIKGTRTAYATYSWSGPINMLTAIPAGGGVDYEATAGKFISVYRTGAVGHADWTTDPIVAWTAGTVPAAWSTYVGANSPEVTCIAGRAIAVYLDASVPRLNIMYSTDGGNTWTNVQKTLTMAAADCVASVTAKPAYNAALNEWYIAVAGSTARKTEVYRSADGGATWTLTASLPSNDWVVNDIAAVGSAIVMTNDDARIAFSIDRGVTWSLATRLIGSAARRYLRVGGGGFMSWNSADKTTFFSSRYSDAGVTI